MSLAIYRKYRPSCFGDVLGQDTTVKILRNAASQDKIAHAYLFAGPRGTGKTSLARLIAKTANCETRLRNPEFRKKGEPCGQCWVCEEIDKGRALDVIEIDAASNRGIDEIRDLKESVRTAPASLANKVFIIDEAHQLTKEAFNALLKTLEEPPANVIIILATTELDKIPATVASRTQIFHFKRAPLPQILAKLERIAKEEEIGIAQPALELISVSAEGSFRDAESLLDQLVSFGYTDIKPEDVEKMIGKVGFKKIANFASCLLQTDLSQSLQRLNELYDEGINLAHFAKDLIVCLRKSLVLQLEPRMQDLFKQEMTEEMIQSVKENGSLASQEYQISLIKHLISAYSQMKYSQFPLIPLEVAIIEALKKK